MPEGHDEGASLNQGGHRGLAPYFIHKKNKPLGIVSAPIGILIMLSTVFIKQHAVLDIIGGILLASFVFWVFRKRVF